MQIFKNQAISRNMKIYLLTMSILVLASAEPNMALLGINSTASRTIMADFLAQNPTIDTQLNNVSSLPINTSFATLFDYILTNSSIYDQIIPNASLVVPFTWTSNLTQLEKQSLLQYLFTNYLTIFYALMVEDLYPVSQTQCQALMNAVIATNDTNYIDAILTPLTGTYFHGKRCILIYTNYLYVVDNLQVNLSYAQKVGLIPTILRMNSIHKLIFGIV